MTTIIIALTTTLFYLDPDPACAHPDEGYAAGPYSFRQQLLRTALVPASLLRLDQGGGTGLAPLGCHAGWHVLGVIAVGLPTAYLLVALRNYLRTPAEK